MSSIHNCHIHVFTSQAVPDGFLPLRLMKLLRTRIGSAIARFALRMISSFSGIDRFDRVAAFVGIGNKRSQEEILREAGRFYPRDTRFIALALDMDHMGAGTAPQPYAEQLAELVAVKEGHAERLLPFVSADPRRENHVDVVREHIEQHGFAGIKLYPPLGFYPCEDRLRKLYRYAEDNQVPILAHCSRGGIYYKGRITDEMRKHPRTGEWFGERSNAEFTAHFTDPRNYTWVLEEFQNLRICLAHYGGNEEWNRYLDDPWPHPDTKESWLSVVSELIRSYPHVYTDIAYTAHERRLWPLIKVLMNTEDLKDRIIYGSDYYMVRLETSEREFSINFRAAVGETEYRQMAVTNARRFLEGT